MEQVFRAAIGSLATPNASSSGTTSVLQQQQQQPGLTDTRPTKRRQVKNACTNCQKACKKCDDARPCPRCIRYNIADTCVNSVRKERKKGIKRGPYKKRQKNGDENGTKADGGQQQNGGGQGETVRPVPLPFSFPGHLAQYATQPYDYAQYFSKDALMNTLIATYSSMGYPVLVPVPGDNNQGQKKEDQGGEEDASAKPASPPGPSTSASSTSSPEAAKDNEASNFERLSQLCTAALKQAAESRSD